MLTGTCTYLRIDFKQYNGRNALPSKSTCSFHETQVFWFYQH